MKWSSQVSEFSFELQELGSLEIKFMVQLLNGLVDGSEVMREFGEKRVNGVCEVRKGSL